MSASSDISRRNTLVSLADWEQEASRVTERQCPPGTWGYFASGAGDDVTLRRNTSSFEAWHLIPRVLVDVSKTTTAHEVLGHHVSQPFGIAPTAFHRLLHPAGEVATAQAAAESGVVYCVSSFATTALEVVASAGTSDTRNGVRFMQIYAMHDRAATQLLVERATACGGYAAIVLTVDRPVLGRRDTNTRAGFDVPWELHGDPNGLGAGGHRRTSAAMVPSETQGGGSALNGAAISAALTWSDVAWLRTLTPLPVVVKGIMCASDACLAVRAGAAAVWVSNHGGRQLDCCPAPLDVLPGIVAAVRDFERSRSGNFHRTEVWMDGGVRRGVDVVKCIALGADFVWIGRPPLWGLAVDGQVGCSRVLQTLGDEVLNTLQLLGITTIREVTRAHVAPVTNGAENSCDGCSCSCLSQRTLPATSRHRDRGYAGESHASVPMDVGIERTSASYSRVYFSIAAAAAFIIGALTYSRGHWQVTGQR